MQPSCGTGPHYEHSQYAGKYLTMLEKANLDKEERTTLTELENLINKCLPERQVQVVFSTCHKSAHHTSTEFFRLDVIIIDEAAAVTTCDLATRLASYMESPTTVVTVVDPKQPKSMFSAANADAAAGLLETNIFRRLADGDQLSTRMEL
jgi:AmiR/NasT family two-component response regulator